MAAQKYQAVIFDIGGVVMRSPFIAIAAYEQEQGLPENYINCSIVERGSQGSWQKFERGEIELLQFYEAFGRDLSDTVNGNKWYKAYCERKGLGGSGGILHAKYLINGKECPRLPEALHVNGRELFGAMMHEAGKYNPHFREAIVRIRAAKKHKVIALTNNFSRINIPQSELEFLGWSDGATPSHLRELFDDFCDSSALRMRKPEAEFYLLACARNQIKPSEAIFLDDIGINLKAAKKLGMDTIHVPIGGTFSAVKELEAKIGIDLTSKTVDAKL